MPNGKVYDPLVGQWMSPQWEGMLTRATEPQQLHLYRFNGNDPINVVPTRQYLKGNDAQYFNIVLNIFLCNKYFRFVYTLILKKW